MIISITLGRVYNLGNYETLRLEATASVQDDDVEAAFDEAQAAVETEYAHQCIVAAPKKPAEPPASDKQRRYIARLQDDLCWTSEQLAVYASEQGIDLAAITLRQASTFIDGMKRLAEERPPARGDEHNIIPF